MIITALNRSLQNVDYTQAAIMSRWIVLPDKLVWERSTSGDYMTKYGCQHLVSVSYPRDNGGKL